MSNERLDSGRTYWRLFWLGLSALGVLGAIGVAAALVGSSPARAAPWQIVSEHRRKHADHHERFASHAEWMTRRWLHRLDASEEQQDAIRRIVDREVEALLALRGDGDDHRADWLTLLRADTIDRDAIEALRREHLDQADRVSAQLAQALVEVAEVLTVEQRQELLDMAKEHRSLRRHRWH
jgi:Spy/CpxP family protein refolding chaperone